jgi:acyl transferase domain-containing protein/acyl carrier protein
MKREYTGNEVAIIGISCRFPQSPDWQSFWRNLLAGKELVSFFSPDEIAAAAVPAAISELPNYVPAKAFLEDTDCFDYRFFGYSQREAEKMDPQLRVLHEVTFNAFVDAGMRPGKAAINAGVFIGSTLNLGRLERFARASEDIVDMFDLANYNDPASFATQIAYRMKLIGPAVNVQTACSTSLSAVHMACKALLAGECDMALAGGVCITDPVAAGYVHRDAMILSPDGHCRPFSDGGNGTVNGNGAALVLLKLLDNAVADADPVHAVIVESAMNNDGDRKVSFEAPSVQGQADVISQVYRVAGIPFSSLGLIEAHGTATVLGDPIEIQALNKVARELLTVDELSHFRCAVGSVKSNMGHLDAAAGIAGLIKAALSVRFGRIPPSLHFTKPNPHLNLHNTPFWVPTAAMDWPKQGHVRRAGVSSFGIGGTNVHVLLEQPPEPELKRDDAGSGLNPAAEQTAAPLQILPLSAASPCSLSRLVRAYATHLAIGSESASSLAVIARQLQENRAEHSCRAAFVVDSVEVWKYQLERWTLMDAAIEPPAEVVWLFAGQGSQLPGMGLPLAEVYPSFGELYLSLLDLASRRLQVDRQWLLQCLAVPGQASTLYLQPVLYAQQVALGVWLHNMGCKPSALCGFSLGEFAAAAIAGVFDPQQGMELVLARARLMDAMPRGVVFAVTGVPRSGAEFPPTLWPIAQLSPETWSVATAEENAAAVESWLTQRGYAFKRVEVSHAFHTPLIEPAAKAFGDLLSTVDLRPAQCPIYSTAVGRRIDPDEMRAPAYWVNQMMAPVQWATALQHLTTDFPGSLFSQIGTGTGLLQQARKWGQLDASRLLPTWGADATEEVNATLAFIAAVWARGARIEWSQVRPCSATEGPMTRSHLPGHAFERSVSATPPRTRDQTIASLFFGSNYYGVEWEKVSVHGLERTADSVQATTTWIICPRVTERERCLAEALAANEPKFIECPGWEGSFKTVHADLQVWLVQQGLQASGAMDVIVTGLLDDLDTEQTQFWSFWLPTVLARWSSTALALKTLRLIFPATGMASWDGAEILHPEKNQLQGPLLIVPEEYPGISVLCVDLERSDVESVVQGLRPWIRREWRGGHFYCFRRDAFWRRRLTSRIQHNPVTHPLPNITRNSWVLVTGASGGMGRAIAEHLAQVYRCNLLLLVRGGVPKESQWVRQLRSTAGQVEIVQADLSDGDALANAFAPVFRLAARGMGIDYVFHTAGRGEGALLQLRSETDSIETLGPKVTGTRFLCENRARLGNPVLLLFSSLGNLLPKEKVGQVAYVAANACLEAYAEHVRRNSGKALAIAWDDWAETGMAIRSAQQLDRALHESSRAPSAEPLIWRRRLSARNDWWLHEHRLDASTTVMPAMAMVVLVHDALRELRGSAAATFSLHDVTIERPLVVTDESDVDVAVVFAADLGAFEIYSGGSTSSPRTGQKHAGGKVNSCAVDPLAGGGAVFAQPTRPVFRAMDAVGVSPKGVLKLGARWRNVLAVDQSDDEVVNLLQLPAEYRGEAQALGLHVALLDTATLIASPEQEGAQFAPVSIGSFTQFAPMVDRVKSRVEVRPLGSGKLLQVQIFSEDGSVLVEITDLVLVDAVGLLRRNAVSTVAPPPSGYEEVARHRVMRLCGKEQGVAEFAFVSQLEPRREPGPLEVEIQVKAVGLNFKDVLIALGVFPAPTDATMTFGQEAAGVITRVGSEVNDLRVADRVMCAGHSCLAEHVLMPRRVVAKIPRTLGFQQAAGIPVAFTTAWIALRHAAHLQQGERILIHSAAGGVGMAAMQIALNLRANVWVTAGSEEKRQLLRDLGAQGAAHSRTREFGNTFRRDLGDRPFDVVLNSLAGELQEESISLLAPQGRFLELGLRDILQNGQLALSTFAAGGSFHAVQASADHPAYERAWAEVVALLEDEILVPLPTRIYPATQIADAFQFMAQGRHTGKIVIAMPERDEERGFVEKLRAEGLTNIEGTRIAMAMGALAVGMPLSYVAVSKLPIGLVLEKQQNTQRMLIGGSMMNATATAGERDTTALNEANADELLEAMRSMLESFLGVAGLDPDASFFALGATSLDLIQFARRLEQRLEREVPVALLFKAASLRELSKELAPSPATEEPPQITQQTSVDRRRMLDARRKLRGVTS